MRRHRLSRRRIPVWMSIIDWKRVPSNVRCQCWETSILLVFCMLISHLVFALQSETQGTSKGFFLAAIDLATYTRSTSNLMLGFNLVSLFFLQLPRSPIPFAGVSGIIGFLKWFMIAVSILSMVFVALAWCYKTPVIAIPITFSTIWFLGWVANYLLNLPLNLMSILGSESNWLNGVYGMIVMLYGLYNLNRL